MAHPMYTEEENRAHDRDCVESDEIFGKYDCADSQLFLIEYDDILAWRYNLQLENNQVVGFSIDFDKSVTVSYREQKLYCEIGKDSGEYSVDLQNDTTTASFENLEFAINYATEWRFEDIRKHYIVFRRQVPLLARIWLERARCAAMRLQSAGKIIRENNVERVQVYIQLLNQLLEVYHNTLTRQNVNFTYTQV
jgi:hypothetical protein